VTPTVLRFEELEWIERDDGRRVARLSEAMERTRANLWRYPPGTKGIRHLEKVQEEVFAVLDGRLTLLLGEPPEPAELGRGDVAVVPPGTPLQVRNNGEGELLLLIYGAPPEPGQAEYLEDA
jgi:mannose-6-phosphate isomerase-like protein (cupin superfamily)